MKLSEATPGAGDPFPSSLFAARRRGGGVPIHLLLSPLSMITLHLICTLSNSTKGIFEGVGKIYERLSVFLFPLTNLDF